MIFLTYNLLLTLLLLLAAPYLLLRGLLQKRFRQEWAERICFFPHRPVPAAVWVHAASVGEVFCSVPLLKKIKTAFPRRDLVLTTMTRTGNEAARTRIPEVDRVLYFPIDHPLFLGRAIRRIAPRLVLIAETELWPNLLRCCGRRNIPVVLFNGRISQKSFRRYLLFRFFFKRCLEHVSLFLMQTEEDRDRIIQMGASMDKTTVVGNLKFDLPSPASAKETGNDLFRRLGLNGTRKILIAGSTHAGEEEILIPLFKDLRASDPNLLLLLAPRHLDRLEEVERVLNREAVRWGKKTSLLAASDRPGQRRTPAPEVILLDTMGELMSLYSVGTLVFIGGSLVPVGGHNPLEPLFFKKCVLFGPHMFHFSEISRHLTAEGGAIRVKDREELSFQLKRLLSNEKARNEVGENGFRFIQKHRGSTERIFAKIHPFLRES